MLLSAIPPAIHQQCLFEEDLTSAQILYRTMVLAAPASREDKKMMIELLTQPKEIEITKLHDHLIMWQFARIRLVQYGFALPEASMLFDTLKMACNNLQNTDGDFEF